MRKGIPGENKKGQPGSDSGRARSESYKKERHSRFVKDLGDPDGQTTSKEGYGNLPLLKEQIYTVKAEEFLFRVNGQHVPLESDTGASVCTLSSHWVKLLQLKVEPSSKRLNAYDNSAIQVIRR